jgi:hypothetical protein
VILNRRKEYFDWNQAVCNNPRVIDRGVRERVILIAVQKIDKLPCWKLRDPLHAQKK